MMVPVRLASADKARAAAVLVKAFAEDPGFIWVVPDSGERYRHLDRFFRALVAHAVRYGRIYSTPDVMGVALWLPPGGDEPNLWQLLRGGFALPLSVLSLGGESRRRMGDLMTYNDDVHRRAMRRRPHWYLGALGVLDGHRGQGIGGSLLQPVLAEADASRVPCYLETQNERNAHFYERFGFAVVKEGGPEGYPVRMWAMVREPRV